MVVIATGAGVHGCHEHKGTREGDAVLGTRYIDDPILERLAKNLQYRALKLRQLIQEKDAVVRQGNLSGLRVGASAHQCHL